FEVGPVFRAEACSTNRHASEFTSVDVELSWIDGPDELLDLEEALLREALGVVRVRHGAEVEAVLGAPVAVPDTPIPRLTVDEAARIAGEPDAGGRLTHQAEQALCKHAHRTSGHSFVFVTGYPADERPFYTHQGDGTGATRSFDLLWGGMEV